jgi:hypothetical protein
MGLDIDKEIFRGGAEVVGNKVENVNVERGRKMYERKERREEEAQ